jgi:predicted RNA-binding Zn-ribbon protein involved in translation (DUF1610 family)
MKCQSPGCGAEATVIAAGLVTDYSATRPILRRSFATFKCPKCRAIMKVMKTHHPDDVQTEKEANACS